MSAHAELTASAGAANEQPAGVDPAAAGVLYHDLRPMTRIGSASPQTAPPLAAAADAVVSTQPLAAVGSAAPRAAWPMEAGAKHRKVPP